jgi:uncharacterized OB-fold protein
VSESLAAVRCLDCGLTAYPALRFGCENCGAYGERLAPVTLTGRGTVLARASLNSHPSTTIPLPALVAEIQLEEGPVLRARVQPGTAAAAAVIAAADDYGPVFRPMSEVSAP